MKKLLSLFISICVSLFAAASQTINVGGTVKDLNTGLPIAGQMVFICANNIPDNPDYFNMVNTGSDGVYNDFFEILGNSPEGVVDVFIIDCSGLVQSQQLSFGNGNFNLTADFQICTVTTVPTDCYSDFGWWQNTNQLVQFEDYSWPVPTSWYWNFGDGETSTQQNPAHQYLETGSYNVTLTIYEEETGCSSTTSWTIWVESYNFDCQAYFSWNQSSANPLMVEFYDYSFFVPGSWNWDFGDGQFSTAQHPIHIFAEPGAHEVVITIYSNDSTCYDVYTHVIFIENFPNGCNADFWYYQTGISTLQFQNISSPPNIISSWDFGDGATSSVQNPEHIFAGSGTYQVCLTHGDPALGCQDVQCYDVLVDTALYLDCLADFYWWQTGNLLVQFEDNSWPNPTSCAWNFGDNQTSYETNPVHQYTEPGTYSVSLTIYIAETGCLTTTMAEILVEDLNFDCHALYFWNQSYIEPFTVGFFDLSLFTPGAWSWDFGDGTSSDEQNPEHSYPAQGTYTVTLTINNADSTCVEQYSDIVEVENFPYNCFADFYWYQTATSAVKFQNISYPANSAFFWDFGDGTTSVEQNPEHQFNETGLYLVCLTITNDDLNCADSSCYDVLVGQSMGCEAGYYWIPNFELPRTIEFYDMSVYSGQVNWLWDFGDGNSSNEQNPVHTFTNENTYQVSLTVSSPESGCYCQFISDVNVGGIVPPDCFNDFNVFAQTGLTFVFEGFLPNSAMADFFWDFGDGTSGLGQSVTHPFTEPGSYAVCLTTFYQNSSDSCFFKSCKGIYAGSGNGTMQAGFTMLPDSLAAMVYHFFDTSTGNPVFWMWDFGDGTISTDQNPSHEYAESGWYEVCLTVAGQELTDNYCAGLEMSAGPLIISFSEKQFSSGEIFPNPNDGTFTINFDVLNPAIANISIFNFLGQNIYHQSENMTPGSNSLKFSFPELSQGIYSLMICCENQKLTKKFIIR